jgi:hypothetical protein
MSYVINKTDGTVLTTLFDGTTNTDTGLTLIGRNYTNYGEVQNENFVRLLENFADTVPPGQSVGFAPIEGQLWWDTTNSQLKVYNGATFTTVQGRVTSATAPESALNVGDQWWDSASYQLFAWTGSDWYLIGPPLPFGQDKSGLYTELIYDTSGNSHYVSTTYLGGNIVSVVSQGNTFTTNSTFYSTGLSYASIQPGINLPTAEVLNANAVNSIKVGGLYANILARTDVDTTFTKDITVNKNLVLGSGNVSYNGNILQLKNTAFGGNMEFYVNSIQTGNSRALSLDGQTGLAYVYQDPVSSLGIATKGYTDTLDAATNAFFLANVGYQQGQILGTNVAIVTANTATNDRMDTLNSAMSANVIAANAAIVTANVAMNARVDTVNSALVDRITAANAAIVTTASNLTNYIDTNNTAIIDAWTANAVSQSVQIASTNTAIVTANTGMKNYVDAADVVLAGSISSGNTVMTNYVNNQVTTANTRMNSYVDAQVTALTANAATQQAAIVLRATIAGPALTGIPTAPTAAAGTNTAQLATTAFVFEANAALLSIIEGTGSGWLAANVIQASQITAANAAIVTANTALKAYTDNQITTANTALKNYTDDLNTVQATAINLKAPLAGPTLTGIPLVPTAAPLTWSTASSAATGGVANTQIASTSFVNQSISNQKFNYTVSGSGPSGGNDGDFWFQIG